MDCAGPKHAHRQGYSSRLSGQRISGRKEGCCLGWLTRAGSACSTAPWLIGLDIGDVVEAIIDGAESPVRTTAKIAIDFFKMSRSMRNRSFSRCRRAISAAWSAAGSVACVVGRRVAAVGSRPAPRSSTQRRNTDSRRPSSLATDPIERPLEATRSTACRLYSSVNDRRRRPSIRHLLAPRAYYRCPLKRGRFTGPLRSPPPASSCERWGGVGGG